jgi:hypothetical protein
MKFLLTITLLLITQIMLSKEVVWNGKSVDLSHGKLMVSENKRFLVFEDGTPFFYLGDTAWELFHRLTKEEAIKYLENRRQKGFTVIQAVILAELDGLNTPNSEGQKPLINNDPTKINEAYFEHVDWVIREAEKRGMFIGLLPTWGDKWNLKWGVGPVIFTPENAKVYGEKLGMRYRNFQNIIWILGGDRHIENDEQKQIIIAMASGIAKTDDDNHLITFHPMGGHGSSEYFHNEEWLNFNMRQNGHNPQFTGVYENTLKDYNLKPAKPVIDGEPMYEDHPIKFNPKENGHSTSADIRRPLYWDLFCGAFGHTYGHHSIWQMWQPGREPVNFPLMPWYEALDQPGAWQMQFGRRLMESRPFLSRIPDNSVIVTEKIHTSVPGAGTHCFAATRDIDGSYAMVYVPVGRKFKVRLDVISGKEVIAWWYNPRNGEATKIGKFNNNGTKEFISPTPGENLDWILVLDNAEKGFDKPGKLKR